MVLHHCPVEIDGHLWLWDAPWFCSKEEYEEAYNSFVAWAREQMKE